MLFETNMAFMGLSFLVTEQSLIKNGLQIVFFAMFTSNFRLYIFLYNTTQNLHS